MITKYTLDLMIENLKSISDITTNSKKEYRTYLVKNDQDTKKTSKPKKIQESSWLSNIFIRFFILF